MRSSAVCARSRSSEAGDAISEDIVQFGDAVFRNAIETLQLVSGIDDLALQGGDAPIKLALEIADEVVVLNTGYVAHAGNAASLRSNDRLVEQLLGIY